MGLHHIQWGSFTSVKASSEPVLFGKVTVRGPNYSRAFYGDYWRSSLLILPRFGCFE